MNPRDESVERSRDLACDVARGMVVPYLDGECSREDARRVALHVASCPRCASTLEVHRRLARGLAEILRPPAQTSTRPWIRAADMRRRIEDRTRRWRVVLLRAAAAVFVGTSLLWLWTIPTNEPPPEELLVNLDLLEELQEEGVELDPEVVQVLLGMPHATGDTRSDSVQDLGAYEDLLEEDLSPENL